MHSVTYNILNWFKTHKRDLPWREDKDPYKIWISEIILQQTRVNQGLQYFIRFIERFPDVNSLASADEDQALLAWKGLGYYSRARNLHKAAKIIQVSYNGEFPADYRAIKNLPGIGDYTAAAISSIAFNLNNPAIDGNVKRVISRIFGIEDPIDKKAGMNTIYETTLEIMDKSDPGNFNQALMDFGSLQCAPKSPECGNCPIRNNCVAYSSGKVGALPVKSRIKKSLKKRYLHYFRIENEDEILITKRNDPDIWKNLYELPLIEHSGFLPVDVLVGNPKIKSLINAQDYAIVSEQVVTHLLSHQKLKIKFINILIKNNKLNPANHEALVINKSDANNYSFPRPVDKHLFNIYT